MNMFILFVLALPMGEFVFLFFFFFSGCSRCLGTKLLKRGFQAVIMKDVLCGVPMTVCRKLLMSLIHRELF